MDARPEKGLGFKGQRRVVLSGAAAQAARRGAPPLRVLLATGAGFFPRAEGHLRRRPHGAEHAILIYCARGGGWCEAGHRLHPVRPGDLLVLAPGEPHAYGAHLSDPWTIHWAHATGDLLADYLGGLRTANASPVMRVGQDLELVLLFNEVLKTLEAGTDLARLLHASATLGHLMTLAALRRQAEATPHPDHADMAGRCIVHMSEHLDRPLRVSALSSLAGLSAGHFSARFKEQTGCSPRDYLRLLRMHRACQLLRETPLSIKEIAARVGYQDPFHFSRQFKAFEGVSPSAYRVRGGAAGAVEAA